MAIKPKDIDTKKIQQDVFAETQKAFEKAGWTAEKIAQELALMGFSDMANHVSIDDYGSMVMKSIEEMGKNSKCIKKVKEKTVITESKDGSELYKTSTVEYELHDKLGALRTGIDVIGIKAPDKLDVTGKIKLEDLVAGE